MNVTEEYALKLIEAAKDKEVVTCNDLNMYWVIKGDKSNRKWKARKNLVKDIQKDYMLLKEFQTMTGL